MNGKYKYQRLFSDKERRMMTDDTFFEVTEKDVSQLLKKLKMKQKPQSFIQAMRKKYDKYIDDTEKRIRQEFGLNYEEDGSIVTVGNACYINGYTPNQWRMLHVDDYIPPTLQSVTTTIYSLEKMRDYEAVEFLKQKYKTILEQRDKPRHEKLGIPEDVPITSYRNKQVNGLPLKEWRVINDPACAPTKQRVAQLINKYSKLNDIDKVNTLCRKYSHILDSGSDEPNISLEEAESFFAQLLGDLYSRNVTEDTNGHQE